jgi:hypothetical protein
MKILFRILGLAVLAALGWFIWVMLFPAPETVIRKRLAKVAELLTFKSNEGMIARAANAQQLTGYFTPQIEIVVDTPSHSRQTVSGRDELYQAVLGTRSLVPGLNVEFVDLQVTVTEEKTNATVNVTGKAKVPGDRDFFIQELKFFFKKTDGDWLINRVETVRTLN